jgi:hypothetical protein
VNKLAWSKSKAVKVEMESSQAGGFLFTGIIDWGGESKNDSLVD